MQRAPQLSARARRMPASPIRRFAPLAAAAVARGRTVHHLNIGQPDIATPPELLDRLRAFDRPYVSYGPSEGLPEFRQAVCRYYSHWGIDVSTDELFVTTCGSEALLFIFGALCDAGDEVLVFEPFYTNYNGFAELVGVRTVAVTTRAEDGYHLPSEEAIAAKLSDRTRAIVLCSPNNPTGTVYSRAELERVASICRERGLFLVADEVYREFTYDGRRHESALSLRGLEDRVIVADSLSKRVSLCGARVGWIVSRNPELMDALLKFGQARLCPPTLGQWIGAGLDLVPQDYFRDVVDESRKRRDLVFGELSRIRGVRLERPEGAFYCCARLPVDDAEGFAEFLLRDFAVEDETVSFAPASGFYATPGLGRDEARVAYVLDRERLARSMRILARGLEAYPGRT